MNSTLENTGCSCDGGGGGGGCCFAFFLVQKKIVIFLNKRITLDKIRRNYSNDCRPTNQPANQSFEWKMDTSMDIEWMMMLMVIEENDHDDDEYTNNSVHILAG